jgi:hypothetical protein
LSTHPTKISPRPYGLWPFRSPLVILLPFPVSRQMVWMWGLSLL